MKPEDRDDALLWDMLEHARIVRSIASQTVYFRYINDRTLQLAVERAIEIVGEAARKVSDACKTGHAEIPWRGIVAMRNVLAHEYGDIKHERMWVVATERIPKLIEQLEKLGLTPPGDGQEADTTPRNAGPD